jgi:hypothetical protein
MPDTDRSSADVLRGLLVSATSSTIYASGDRDRDRDRDLRRRAFDELVTVMDRALDGDVALYATHSFEDVMRNMSAPLIGWAYAATSTLIVSAQVSDWATVDLTIRPLHTISAVTVSSSTPDAVFFVGHDMWSTRKVTIALEGTSVTFPAARSTSENTAAFAAFYPTLIAALRAA